MPNSLSSRAPRRLVPTSTLPFSEDCKDVLQRLRGSLIDALTGLGVDPSRPQDMGRTLGLHRNLSWKVSKIVTGTDVFALVPHIPGKGGMEIVARALGKAGAPSDEVTRIRSAMAEFERMVQVHAGDRGTLEIVAGGLVPGVNQAETQVQARRMAFRGNSAIWGVQARLTMSTHILAPNVDDPTMVDLILINGLADFRALRTDVVWPMFRRAIWGASTQLHSVEGQPVGSRPAEGGVPLLHDFCSPDLPELEVVRSEHETVYWLPARDLGRTGEMTCIYASVIRGLGSQYATGTDDRCELETNLVTPAEMLQSDVLAHESLSWAHSPKADVYSLLEQRSSPTATNRGRMRLPIDETSHELGLGLGTMVTQHFPRYREMLSSVFASVGWDPAQFRGFRYTLAHPPVPSRASLWMPLLPERAKGKAGSGL